jgi:hypothetical protein
LTFLGNLISAPWIFHTFLYSLTNVSLPYEDVPIDSTAWNFKFTSILNWFHAPFNVWCIYLTYTRTSELTSCCRLLIETLMADYRVMKFSGFYRAHSFHRNHQLQPNFISWIQYLTSYFPMFRFNITVLSTSNYFQWHLQGSILSATRFSKK